MYEIRSGTEAPKNVGPSIIVVAMEVSRQVLFSEDQKQARARVAIELYEFIFAPSREDRWHSLEAVADACSDELVNQIGAGQLGDVKQMLADADVALGSGPVTAHFEAMRRRRLDWAELRRVTVQKQKIFLDGLTRLELHAVYYDWLRQRQVVHVDTLTLMGDQELHGLSLDEADGRAVALTTKNPREVCAQED